MSCSDDAWSGHTQHVLETTPNGREGWEVEEFANQELDRMATIIPEAEVTDAGFLVRARDRLKYVERMALHRARRAGPGWAAQPL
jgi:hypothetical protein